MFEVLVPNHLKCYTCPAILRFGDPVRKAGLKWGSPVNRHWIVEIPALSRNCDPAGASRACRRARIPAEADLQDPARTGCGDTAHQTVPSESNAYVRRHGPLEEKRGADAEYTSDRRADTNATSLVGDNYLSFGRWSNDSPRICRQSPGHAPDTVTRSFAFAVEHRDALRDRGGTTRGRSHGER